MLTLAAALLAAASPAPPPRPRAGIIRSLSIRLRALRGDPRTAPQWREKGGPDCIRAGDVGGATVVAPDIIDFTLKGGTRMRARLENECPALDYYGGFYVSPQGDGRICADRDAIRTRAGGECGIDRFRRLVPPTPSAPRKP